MEGIQLTAALCLESSVPLRELLVPAPFLFFLPFEFIWLHIFHMYLSETFQTVNRFVAVKGISDILHSFPVYLANRKQN